MRDDLHGRCARICCFGLSALEARCLQCALSLLKVLYAMTLFSSVIPGLTRNPGGYGSNIDLDSGSEAGVTDKKTGRSDRREKMLCRDRNREIRRSLDIFSIEKMRDDLHGRCARICCFGLSALEARCLQCALSLLKVLYAMTLFSSVIPGLTRNPGGYGSNIDLDSGSEAGVTIKERG